MIELRLNFWEKVYPTTALPQPRYFQFILHSSSAHPECQYVSCMMPCYRSSQASVPCAWLWLCYDFPLLNHSSCPTHSLTYLFFEICSSHFPLFTFHALLSTPLCVDNFTFFIAVLSFINKLELHMMHIWVLNVLMLLTLTFEYFRWQISDSYS